MSANTDCHVACNETNRLTTESELEGTRHIPATAEDKRMISFCGRKIQSGTLLIIFTVSGVLLGLILGIAILPADPSDDAIMLIKFPGDILLRLLKQLVIPIIMTSIIAGVASLDTRKSGKIATHALLYYMTTTVLAVVLGIALVSMIQPGKIRSDQADTAEQEQTTVTSTLDTFLDLVRNIFPSNIIAACFQVDRTRVTVISEIATGNGSLENITTVQHFKKEFEKASSTNALGLITFSIFFGITLASIGQEVEPVVHFFTVLNKAFLKMIMVVIWYSPIGICSLVAGNILKTKSILMLVEKLGLYMVTVLTGLVIHALLVLPVIYWIFTRKNPFVIYRGVFQAWLTALGTASSAGTLPITISCMEKNLKIDERVTRFVLPLGATINMDGTALLEAVAAITIVQMNGVILNFGQIITISITATAASIGAAAIPGAGLVTLLLVLSAIGVPTDLVAILWSIDWILDRVRTSVNVVGDCIGAAIVHHLNRDILARCDVPDVESAKGRCKLDLYDSGLSMGGNNPTSVVS